MSAKPKDYFYTRDEVAADMGITRMTLYRWEKKFKPITEWTASHIQHTSFDAIKEWVGLLLKKFPALWRGISKRYLPGAM